MLNAQLGLLSKALREAGGLVLAASLGAFLAASLLIRVLPEMQQGIDQFLAAVPAVGGVLTGFLGIPVMGVSSAMLQGLMWAHPVLLTLLWGLGVALCTRYPAGEVEQGTVDLLLSWPLSRGALFLNYTLVWMAAGGLVCLAALAGFQLSSHELEAPAAPLRTLALVAANLYLTYLAVGGLASLISSLSSRRGTAVALMAAGLLSSYLLNFLAFFWDWAERLAWLSLSTYYQPGRLLMSGRIPEEHAWTLLLFALATVLAAALVSAHRDVATA